MAIQMTATKVRAQILALLDQVAEGEEIEITKHGRTIARLVPATGPATGAGTLEGIAVSGTDEELFCTEVDWTLG